MSKKAGRPLTHNLRRDGWERCADYVRRVVQFNKGPFRVYVADDGAVRVRPASDCRCIPRPDSELVGTYNKKAHAEVIEDDIRMRLHELQETEA